jgi:carboxypeptidase PM20D1
MKWWIIVILSVVGIIVILGATLAIKTAVFTSRQVTVTGKVSYPVDVDKAAERLAKALQFKTFSDRDKSKVDHGPFTKFQEYLANTYPLADSTLEKKVINDYGLLYIWKGTDTQKKPALLLAHQDTVPASAEGWKYDPFSGTVADGYIWGRGALDDKSSVLGILESVDYLIKDGFKPARTIYLAFGFDEEVGGKQGAGKIAAYLKAQNVQFEYIIDEGDIIIVNAYPTPRPVALIGIAEKGYVTVELSAESAGGHASSPPAQTTIGIIARAIDKIQSNPYPGGITGPTAMAFDYVGPELAFPTNVVFANMWLFAPLIEGSMGGAEIRTTMAPTMIQANSDRDNILPTRTSVLINIRPMPGTSIESILQRIKLIVNDPRVTVKTSGDQLNEASPVANTNSTGFMLLNKTIREVLPDTIVAPGLVTAGTDSTNYFGLSDCILRFEPQRLTPADLARIHGVNERISVSNYGEVINYYIQLMLNSGK